EQHVALGDGADAAVHHLDLDLGGRELRQCVGEGFRRPALVGLDDDAQQRGAARGALGHEVLECLHAARAAMLRLALEARARLSGFALRSSSSACSRICSSSWSTFVPFFAEMGVASVVPPNSSSTTPWARRSCLTFCTLAVGRSILLIATTIGTPAFLACE